jgi:predicted MFS family arabinose efflux permease
MLLVPARWDRRSVYAAAGLVYASASLLLASGPLSSRTFVVGMLASNFAQGFYWSALTGLILSLMGTPGRSESSRYALLGSLFFASTTYMVWLDGRVIETYGPRSLGLFDAAANLAPAALFFLWWIGTRRFRSQAAA